MILEAEARGQISQMLWSDRLVLIQYYNMFVTQTAEDLTSLYKLISQCSQGTTVCFNLQMWTVSVDKPGHTLTATVAFEV